MSIIETHEDLENKALNITRIDGGDYTQRIEISNFQRWALPALELLHRAFPDGSVTLSQFCRQYDAITKDSPRYVLAHEFDSLFEIFKQAKAQIIELEMAIAQEMATPAKRIGFELPMAKPNTP